MKTFEELFFNKYEPGVYQTGNEIKIAELSHICEDYGFQFFYINGEKTLNKETFIESFAKALSFPDYFQLNWDSFEECIKDLELHSKKGYVIFYDNVDNFVKCASQWRMALDILSSTIESWKAENIPMYIFLRTSNCLLKNVATL